MATEFTKFLTTKTAHAVAGSSKLHATIAGHIFNIKVSQDMDNGTIVAVGDYVEPEVYGMKASTGFAGVIEEKAANGNWYIKVTAPGDAVLLLNDPLIYEEGLSILGSEDNFYNASGDIVRGYQLHVGDIFELSAAGISGTPAKGATVNVTSYKVTVTE